MRRLAARVGVLPARLAEALTWDEIAEWERELEEDERIRLRALAIAIGNGTAYGMGGIDKGKFEEYLGSVWKPAAAERDVNAELDRLKATGLPIFEG